MNSRTKSYYQSDFQIKPIYERAFQAIDYCNKINFLEKSLFRAPKELNQEKIEYLHPASIEWFFYLEITAHLYT